eukprot:COSAG04_NODE_1034_length_8611_cov_4.315672_5_plen_231_part_00
MVVVGGTQGETPVTHAPAPGVDAGTSGHRLGLRLAGAGAGAEAGSGAGAQAPARLRLRLTLLPLLVLVPLPPSLLPPPVKINRIPKHLLQNPAARAGPRLSYTKPEAVRRGGSNEVAWAFNESLLALLFTHHRFLLNRSIAAGRARARPIRKFALLLRVSPTVGDQGRCATRRLAVRTARGPSVSAVCLVLSRYDRSDHVTLPSLRSTLPRPITVAGGAPGQGDAEGLVM